MKVAVRTFLVPDQLPPSHPNGAKRKEKEKDRKRKGRKGNERTGKEREEKERGFNRMTQEVLSAPT